MNEPSIVEDDVLTEEEVRNVREVDLCNKMKSNEWLKKNSVYLVDHFLSIALGSPVKRNFGWLMLSKLIYECDSTIFRTLSSRMQKAIIKCVDQEISVESMHFVRSVLKNMDWLRSLNLKTFSLIVGKALDFAIMSGQSDVIELASSLFSLYSKGHFEDDLLNALNNAFGRFRENELVEGVILETSKKNRYKTDLVRVIFTVHGRVLDDQYPGTILSANLWLENATKSLKMFGETVDETIFRWLTMVIKYFGSSALPFSREIAQLLIKFCRPSTAFYECVYTLSNFGGIPSSVPLFFSTIMNSPKRPLHEQDYGLCYAKSISSLLHSHIYLWNVKDIIVLQQWICEEAFTFKQSLPALKLLNALLSLNHESCQIPIEIAQSIFWRLTSNDLILEELKKGRMLAANICRPIIPPISYKKFERKPNESREAKTTFYISDEDGEKLLENTIDLKTEEITSEHKRKTATDSSRIKMKRRRRKKEETMEITSKTIEDAQREPETPLDLYICETKQDNQEIGRVEIRNEFIDKPPLLIQEIVIE